MGEPLPTVIEPVLPAAGRLPGGRVLTVSIIVPVHNEDPVVVSHLAAGCRAAYGDTELIIVDDGSDPPQPHATLRHERQRGYGAAIKTGIAAAHEPWVATMDGDGQHHVEDLGRLFDFAIEHGLDMAIGDRRLEQPDAVRSLGSQTMNVLARLVTGLPIRDLNCGLRLFRRSLALRYQDQLSGGFSFTTSSVMAFLAEGHRVGWLPVGVQPRTHGGSKVRLMEDGCFTALQILRAGSACRLKRFRAAIHLKGHRT